MRWILVGLGVPAALVVLVVAAWLADGAFHRHGVARNVSLIDGAGAGQPVGGLTRFVLTDLVEGLGAAYAASPVEVRVGEGAITGTAAELGMEIDQATTVAAVMAAGRSGSTTTDLWSWLQGFMEPRSVRPGYRFDPAVARAALDRPQATPRHPVEPVIEVWDGELVVVPGTTGATLDIAAAVEALEELLGAPSPVTVEGSLSPLPPAVPDQAAEETAERLTRATQAGITLTIDQERRWVSPRVVRGWLSFEPTIDSLAARVDREAIATLLPALFYGVVVGGTPPMLEVVDGQVELARPGEPPQGCCHPGAADLVASSTIGDLPPVVELPVLSVEGIDAEQWTSGAGVEEVTGEFTTFHQCCERRVTNIHRIADLVRGQVLMPGDTFSVNEHVG
ncbi:MAG: peptidoglycan binding domain-containing protein, partial [Acidimicrobiia bacterium]